MCGWWLLLFLPRRACKALQLHGLKLPASFLFKCSDDPYVPVDPGFCHVSIVGRAAWAGLLLIWQPAPPQRSCHGRLRWHGRYLGSDIGNLHLAGASEPREQERGGCMGPHLLKPFQGLPVVQSRLLPLRDHLELAPRDC